MIENSGFFKSRFFFLPNLFPNFKYEKILL